MNGVVGDLYRYIIMVYESSYETGRQPFIPDATRGKWLQPNDFIYAGLSLVFRADIISMSWISSLQSGSKYDHFARKIL